MSCRYPAFSFNLYPQIDFSSILKTLDPMADEKHPAPRKSRGSESSSGVVHIEKADLGSEKPVIHEEHGPLIDDQQTHPEVVDDEAISKLWWSKVRHELREPLSEFFGVFIMILFGDGVVAQVVLSSGEKGSYQSISWGWG